MKTAVIRFISGATTVLVCMVLPILAGAAAATVWLLFKWGWLVVMRLEGFLP